MILYISLGFMLRSLGEALQTAENSTFILRQTSCPCQKADTATWSVGSVRPLIGGGRVIPREEWGIAEPGQNPGQPNRSKLCQKWGSASFIQALSPAAARADREQEASFALQTSPRPRILSDGTSLWHAVGVRDVIFLWFGEGGRWGEELGDCGEVI